MRRRWRDLEWIEQFGYVVMAGFAVTIALLLLAMMLNGCSLDLDDPGPTLPPLCGSQSVAEGSVPPAPPMTLCGPLRGS